MGCTVRNVYLIRVLRYLATPTQKGHRTLSNAIAQTVVSSMSEPQTKMILNANPTGATEVHYKVEVNVCQAVHWGRTNMPSVGIKMVDYKLQVWSSAHKLCCWNFMDIERGERGGNVWATNRCTLRWPIKDIQWKRSRQQEFTPT